jgi:DNA-binding response OmpR family regulator
MMDQTGSLALPAPTKDVDYTLWARRSGGHTRLPWGTAGETDRSMLMNGSAALEGGNPKSVGSTIATGKLEVNLDKRLATVDGNPVPLSPTEYEILEFLSLRKGTVLTKEMFLNRLYAGTKEPAQKIIDVLVDGT